MLAEYEDSFVSTWHPCELIGREVIDFLINLRGISS